jgi:hypothetical protein
MEAPVKCANTVNVAANDNNEVSYALAA